MRILSPGPPGTAQGLPVGWTGVDVSSDRTVARATSVSPGGQSSTHSFIGR